MLVKLETEHKFIFQLFQLSSLYQDTLGAVGDIGEIKENFEKAVREQLAMKVRKSHKYLNLQSCSS